MFHDWLTHFKPYTAEHAVCVAVCLAVMAGTSLLGRRLRGTVAGDRLRQGVAWLGIAYWLGSNAWWMWGPAYSFAQSLPIQLCDIAGLIGPVALLTRWPTWRALLYFWGLSLSVQGFIQPTLGPTKGAATVEFWLFWANHTTIVGTALFDCIALGFRPTARDFRIALIGGVIYIGIILLFDVAFRVNYGYVGPSDPIPHAPTLVDALGPWPWRVIPLVALGAAAMALLFVPWAIVDAFSRRRAEGGAGQET